MSILIQSKIPPRQSHAKYPATSASASSAALSHDFKLDVTSAQAKANLNRLAFSPMTAVDGRIKGFSVLKTTGNQVNDTLNWGI